MKLIFTILFGIFVFIPMIAIGFILIVPKDKMIVLVSPLPVIGPHTETIANTKSDIIDRGAYLVDDSLYLVRSKWRDINNFTLTNRVQKIIIELEPVRITKVVANGNQPFASKTTSPTEPKKSKIHSTFIENNSLKITATHPKNETPVTPPTKVPQNKTGANKYKIGMKFYKGIGEASKNLKTARKWFLEAAALGNAAAQYNLGIMSYLGQGIEQNFSDAAKWFEYAAKQDYTLAQYNLGFMFYEGKGVKKNYLQAFMWIDRAARLGDKKAIQARPTIEKMLPEDLIQGK